MDLIMPGLEGAISYLLKDINPTELADAIRPATHGEAVIYPKVARYLLNILQK